MPLGVLHQSHQVLFGNRPSLAAPSFKSRQHLVLSSTFFYEARRASLIFTAFPYSCIITQSKSFSIKPKRAASLKACRLRKNIFRSSQKSILFHPKQKHSIVIKIYPVGPIVRIPQHWVPSACRDGHSFENRPKLPFYSTHEVALKTQSVSFESRLKREPFFINGMILQISFASLFTLD